MKALNVRQPWAWMIGDGMKTLEVRTWKTNYRGPLLIVASARPDPHPNFWADVRSVIPEDLALGSAVAVCKLFDCTRAEDTTEENFYSCTWPLHGKWLWELICSRHIKPFPVKGQLGLYDVDLAPDMIR